VKARLDESPPITKQAPPRNIDDKAARQAALAFEIELERRDRARWIYGGLLNLPSVASGQFLRFDQSEFVRGNNASLSEEAIVYIPHSCAEKTWRQASYCALANLFSLAVRVGILGMPPERSLSAMQFEGI
jgi:hypothetical protein